MCYTFGLGRGVVMPANGLLNIFWRYGQSSLPIRTSIINKANSSDTEASFLNLNWTNLVGVVSSKLDKRDDLDFIIFSLFFFHFSF